MSLKQILQGKWLGHPLHPALVHVPTGLWPAGLLFDVLSWTGGGSVVAVRLGMWCVGMGLFGALLAAPTGLADWWDIKKEKPAHKLGLWHLGLNLCAVLIFAASLIVRWSAPAEVRSTPMAALVLSAAGNAILFVSGYLGGRMVYEHGVSVARLSKAHWRKIAEAGKARLPAE